MVDRELVSPVCQAVVRPHPEGPRRTLSSLRVRRGQAQRDEDIEDDCSADYRRDGDEKPHDCRRYPSTTRDYLWWQRHRAPLLTVKSEAAIRAQDVGT